MNLIPRVKTLGELIYYDLKRAGPTGATQEGALGRVHRGSSGKPQFGPGGARENIPNHPPTEVLFCAEWVHPPTHKAPFWVWVGLTTHPQRGTTHPQDSPGGTIDGKDFKHNSDVAGLTAIRNIVFDPIRRNNDGTLEDITLLSIDIAYAYLQSDLFPASCPPGYLKVKDPVTGTHRYFRQYGVLYGSRSSAVRWQQTLHPWLVSKDFVQGANEPCAFYHKERKIALLLYVDDILSRSSRANAEWFYKELSARFECNKPQ